MLPAQRIALQRVSRLPITTIRRQAIYQPPNPPESEQPNPHRNFYKVFGRPLAKTFLIAVATYQVLYWSWAKLESLEIKHNKEAEMRSLEGELKGLVARGQSAET